MLVRSLRWTGDDAADQLDDLLAITGPPMLVTPAWLRAAAALAEAHRLSFYDASWAAAAAALRIPLVSADRRLVAAALAETPSDIAARLRLTP